MTDLYPVKPEFAAKPALRNSLQFSHVHALNLVRGRYG